MYFTFPCPQCEKSLKVRQELAGRKCACPYCQASIRIPSQPAEPQGEGLANLQIDTSSSRTGASRAGAAQTGAPKTGSARPPRPPKEKAALGGGDTVVAASGSQWTDASNVSLLWSGVWGATAAVLFLALLYPLRATPLAQLFWGRGWVPFVLVLLMCWSLAILVMKWRKLARQQTAMLLDILPTEVGEQITLDSLDKFTRHIGTLPGEPGESFLINRVLRGIEHFRVRKSAPETVTMMELQSDIDAHNVASSYSILKVFIWALPIMGFIGTVLGISQAVGSLAGTLDSATDLSAIKDALNSVFAGLGTAFDTTLLALVMSLIVKIPASALQKSEEGLVTWVDEYCNENLLRRLDDCRDGGAERAGGGLQPEAVREAVQAALAAHQAELESWRNKLEQIGSTLSGQVVQGWEQVNSQLDQQQRERLEQWQQWQEQSQQQLFAQMQQMAATTAQLQQALGGLSQQATAMQEGLTTSLNGSNHALQSHFSDLQRGLSGLNGVLEQLGQQQVLVQQVEPPRRRWLWPLGNGRKK